MNLEVHFSTSLRLVQNFETVNGVSRHALLRCGEIAKDHRSFDRLLVLDPAWMRRWV